MLIKVNPSPGKQSNAKNYSDQYFTQSETKQLIYKAKKLTGFPMSGTLTQNKSILKVQSIATTFLFSFLFVRL